MSRKILSLILTCTIILTVLPATFAADDAPEIHVVADAGDPKTGEAGQLITFSGSAKYGYPPYTFHWDFGDGTTASGKTVTHSFPATQDGSTQTYTVTLTVTDSEGYTDTDTTTATIITPLYHVVGNIWTDKRFYGINEPITIYTSTTNIGGTISPVHTYDIWLDGIDKHLLDSGVIPPLYPKDMYSPQPVTINPVGKGWHTVVLVIKDTEGNRDPFIGDNWFYVLGIDEEPPDDLE